ncbi:hypothetical protein EV363DRAFT_539123 [Boletus edulis]|nr:hypothetical protein EV363DRAFT_539123 [Boletus edulis]
MGALDSTYGALLIGVVAAGVLYGCTFVQTWTYFTHYPSDRLYIKLIVASAFVADTTHQILITHTAYTYLVTNWGVSEELSNVVWSLPLQTFFNGYTTFCVQCFLAMRIYKLSNRSLVGTVSVMVLVVAQFIVVLVYGSKTMYLHTFAQAVPLRGLVKSINITTALGDFIIALFLCILLQRSRTGFRKSDMIINQLIMFSIKTGLLTSLCALASLICISVWPNAFYYMAFYFCVGRLYCNSLLAVLNARKKLRSESQHEAISLCQATQRLGTSSMLGTTSKHIPGNISIKVDTTHEYIPDEQHSASLNSDMKDPEVV